MSFYRDKQIKGFCSFLIIYSLLLLIAGFSLGMSQIHHVKSLYLTHDEAMASSLLEQGVSRGVIAVALNNSEISEAGRSLLVSVGMDNPVQNRMSPFVSRLQKDMFGSILAAVVFLY